MFIACVVIMTLSLGAQGLYFFARDAVTEHLPGAFYVSDWAWLLGMLSILLIKRAPVLSLLIGWASALTIIVKLEPTTYDHSVVWFLARNCLLIVYLGAAHFAAYLQFRRRATGLAPKTDSSNA